MTLLTRPEELILLAVLELKETAYSIPIREYVCRISGENWSLGSIYMPLDRLVKKGYLESYLSDATPERGGRHKRIYTVTREGREALIKVRDVAAAAWARNRGLSLEAE